MDEKGHNFTIDVKELILTQDGKSAGTETFVYEPANIEEEAFGNLYIIGWLQNKRHELEFLPNLVASVIRREFYAIDDRTPEEHFESALKKANATLLDINKNNKDIIHDVHFCVANIVKETIRLCVFGDMLALLSRNNEIADMRQHTKKREKAGLFSDVITGSVAQGDSIILGTKPITDLFSEKGLTKLLSLPLLEQSEIITKIYQKNAKEILLPDQALVLIGIAGRVESQWIPFKKNIGEKKRVDASLKAHERAIGFFTTAAKKAGSAGNVVVQHAKTIPTLSVRKRNARILFGVFAAIIVGGSIYAAINAQMISLRTMERRIHEARAATDTETAVTLLQSVQHDALARIPSLLMSSAAQTIFNAATTDLNALYGIHITPPSFITRIQTSAIDFTPAYIFDDEAFIYVFSYSPNTLVRISKTTGESRFVFLSGEYRDFIVERMLQKNGDIYFINDTKRSALIWRTAANSLASTYYPSDASAVNERVVSHARYVLDGVAITKTAPESIPAKYLIGQLPPLTDFTVSHDSTTLFLLARGMVFALSL